MSALKLLRWLGLVAVFAQVPHLAKADQRMDAAVQAEIDAVVRWQVPESLRRYNRMQVTPDFQVTSATLNVLIMAFGWEPFRCTQQKDHLPRESEAAQQAFAAFLAYYDKTSKQGISVEEKRERIRLIEEAIKAGSWRAMLSDVQWQARENRDPVEARRLAAEVMRMVEQRNPAAMGIAESSLEAGMTTPAERLPLARMAISLGNPALMSKIGHRLATNTLEHRARGLAMLRCAAEQGEMSAYYSLGLTAR